MSSAVVRGTIIYFYVILKVIRLSWPDEDKAAASSTISIAADALLR